MAYKIRKTLIIFWAMVLLLEIGKPLPVAAAVMEREREKSTPSGIAYSDLAERIEKFIEERKSAAASVSLQGCRVLIRIQEEHNKVNVTVPDRGASIPKELEAILIKPFVCEDISRNTRGGNGLGLAITRKIVEKHGGWIYLDTNIEGYTKGFVIEL